MDDLAQACLHLLAIGYDGGLVNIGCGEDVSIRELAEQVCAAVGVSATPVFDPTMPDGPLRKRLDISRLLALGWQPSISLSEGLRRTYRSFLEEQPAGR